MDPSAAAAAASAVPAESHPHLSEHEPLATELLPKTNATLTIRVIKSFEFRTQKSLVLRGLDLETETVGGLLERCKAGESPSDRAGRGHFLSLSFSSSYDTSTISRGSAFDNYDAMWLPGQGGHGGLTNSHRYCSRFQALSLACPW